MTEETQSQAKKFTTTRTMSASRAQKKPEMLNALLRDAIREISFPVFAEANMHEVALVASIRSDVIESKLMITVEAITRPITEAMDFPYAFDEGKPLEHNKPISEIKDA